MFVFARVWLDRVGLTKGASAPDTRPYSRGLRRPDRSLAERHGLPGPGPVDSLLDAAVWSTGVFDQGPVPVEIPQEGHDSDDDSDSDVESEE